MTLPSWTLALPVLLPLLAGLLAALIPWPPRKAVSRGLLMLTLAAELVLLTPILMAEEVSCRLMTLSDQLPILLRADPTGKFFAAVMALVWAAAGIYAIDYMSHEGGERRFFAFYLMTLGILMGLCFSATMVTLYMFYEAMTLLTFPLVLHSGQKEAVAAGVKYLIYSVTGASLALMGLLLLTPYTDGLTFARGGVLVAERMAGHEGLVLAAVFMMLLGFGAKAGMFPLHGWLPTAHPQAPSPASAVLSGVITKAGVLGVLRLIYGLIGPDVLRGTWVQTAFMGLTLFTVLMGSLLAYRERMLKKRLAYSTVSQVSYILFGLSTLHPLGVAGALLHVVCHALVKDSLFMAAGAVILKTGKRRVDELAGIGRRMPVTMGAMLLASLGLIGIPPCLGFVSKWTLAQGSLSMLGVPRWLAYAGPAVLLVSALLTAGYLLPISIDAFLRPGEAGEKCEPGWKMLAPLVALTALSVLTGLFPSGLTALCAALADTLM